MPDPNVRTPQQDMLFGYMPAQILHVAARLGLADVLADGPKTSAEVAAATETHPPSLHRLLRALACLGVVTEIEAGRFELTPEGAQLRSDTPESIRGLVMLFCGDEVWRAWGNLLHSVRTGGSAFEYVTGMPPFEFLAAHPEQSATFDAAMADHTRKVAPEIIAGYDFGRFSTIVDVGGGDGTLMAAILRAVPAARGILFDLPAGVEPAPTTLKSAGVADRCRVVAGSFFKSVPEGGDAYLLKSVIHDWDDDRAAAILRTCRSAMGPASSLQVIEPVLPPRIESPAEITGLVMSDINMLVNTGGRERTEVEFRSLFAAAGLDVTAVVGPFAPSGYRVIEGAPA
ncbi:MAG: methyltransferase [Streptosporangiales bacterium]|nr:methyltransferase [Streptosporangiales bacterium]